MIQLTGITKTYALGTVAVRALRGVSLTISRGEFVAIMGPSGSGKSTLLNVLGLLDVPDTGSYRLQEREVAQLSGNELAALRNSTFGFVFQHFNLLPRTSALENAALPLLYAARPITKIADRSRQRLDELGLGDRALHKPNELSGGEQQRVAIARALIQEPEIILADEPTGNLDSESAAEIMEILKRLNAQGLTIIMVTHEADIAATARRIIRMRDGLIQSDEIRAGGVPVSPSNGKDQRGAASPGGSSELRKGLTRLGAAFGGAQAMLREMPHDFKQAWRALWANKIRSFLSMLGILIGVTAVIAMLAIGSGARESIEEQLASMGSNLLVVRPGARRVHGVAYEAGQGTRFTPQDVAEIRVKVPAAQRAGGVVFGRGQIVYGNKNWNSRVQGVEPDYAHLRAAEPRIGRFFTAAELSQRACVAALGPTVARELFGEASPLGEYIKINKVNFLVIGVLPEKGASVWYDQDDIVVIPLTTAMFRLLGRDYLDSIEVEIRSAEEMPAAQEELRELIIQTHRLPPSQADSFDIRNMAEVQATLTETSRTLSWLLASIAAVSLLVGGIGIMNIMLVSVSERTREIGVRKAVGARERDIFAQFLTEALVISVTGGGVGLLLGWLISVLVSNLAGWPVLVTPFSILLAVGFAGVIGVIFGLWPATKAGRLNPIDALRYE